MVSVNTKLTGEFVAPKGQIPEILENITRNTVSGSHPAFLINPASPVTSSEIKAA